MGCIDSMMNVVVPFIYSHMKVEFNYIRADKEVEYNTQVSDLNFEVEFIA